MSEHTPGPWEAYEHEFEFGWAIEGPPSWGKGHLKRRADAVLAAAAPDLLKALDVALLFISDRAAKRVIFAAIAKARGETTDTVPGTSPHPTEGDG